MCTRFEKSYLHLYSDLNVPSELQNGCTNGRYAEGIEMLPVQVRDQLIFVMAHSRSEVSNPSVCLLGPPEDKIKKRKGHVLT